MSRHAETDHPIHGLLRTRWSPSVYDPRPMPPEDLRSLLEAARWAPSSFNEQPWHYLVALRQDADEFKRLLSCLVEANQTWAQHASALAVTVARQTFTRNGKPNLMAAHDVGLASAQLTVEATSRGMVVHQMGGILPDRVRELYAVPEGFQPLTALAIGYEGDPARAAEELRDRDAGPRIRKPQQEFVFTGAWGQAAKLD
jgi:nitroreductase